jgi:hypothetical protein
MKNKDNQFPASKKAGGYFIMYKFPETQPIFWGPGQNTEFPSSYAEPDKEKWRKNEILILPRIARFIMGSSENRNPCTDPGPDVFTTKLIDKRANLPPYPFDYILVWQVFRNGNPFSSPMTYSIVPFEYYYIDGNPMPQLFSNWDQFFVGLEFPGSYDMAVARILYVRAGIDGAGYYRGATKLTPNPPPGP